jgi:hypothetical protein
MNMVARRFAFFTSFPFVLSEYMSNWQRIRAARTDLTDYVVHLTRLVVDDAPAGKVVRSGLNRLKDILRSGFLLPTTAPRTTIHRNRNHTIRGPYPAVCFTAQPLEQIPITLANIDGASYQPYGIAFNHVDLFGYGGRPVIYGDDEVFTSLDDHQKYLWVRYRPLRATATGYPNDFTFEREWRCRIADTDHLPWEHSLAGVPLLLPDDFQRVARESRPNRWSLKNERFPDFRIIVKRGTEVDDLREFLASLKPKLGAKAYFKIYYAAVKKAKIVSTEHVERMLARGSEKYRRIENLQTPASRINIRATKHKKAISLKNSR